jgi:prefoldin subunit 5
MYKDLLKSAVTLIASAGVGAVVTNAVKATTPDDLKIANKVFVMVGSMVVAHAVSDLASKYTSEQIDEIGKAATLLKENLPNKKH